MSHTQMYIFISLNKPFEPEKDDNHSIWQTYTFT